MSTATMNQAIAGVTPPEAREVTVMTVFPTLAAYGPGRVIGPIVRHPCRIMASSRSANCWRCY